VKVDTRFAHGDTLSGENLSLRVQSRMTTGEHCRFSDGVYLHVADRAELMAALARHVHESLG
jgi:hypothetical protein